MRQPKYYVSLGNVNLHHVESFELSSERDIDDYDGVGAGKFNIPGSKKPREWTISCQLLQDGTKTAGLNTWSASELFKEFDVWLGKTDAPVRMVKTDSIYPAANLSVLVWLKSYAKKEAEDQGVYDVEITVAEYLPVGIKTTGIPTISRPGKVPVPPKVTITKKNTVYQVKKKYTGKSSGAMTYTTDYNGKLKQLQEAKYKEYMLAHPDTGEPVSNPATVNHGAELLLSSVKATGQSLVTSAPKIDLWKAVQNSQAAKTISTAIDKFKKWYNMG